MSSCKKIHIIQKVSLIEFQNYFNKQHWKTYFLFATIISSILWIKHVFINIQIEYFQLMEVAKLLLGGTTHLSGLTWESNRTNSRSSEHSPKVISNSSLFSLLNCTLCVLQNGDIYGKLVTNYSLEITLQLRDLHPHQCQVRQSQKHGNRNTILHPRRIWCSSLGENHAVHLRDKNNGQ